MSDSESVKFPCYFKHKLINHFVVGEFKFRNHLLKIDDQDAYDRWMNHFEGLLEVDRVNIVQVMNIENERPVAAAQTAVIRGGLNTANTAGDLSGHTGVSEAQRRLEERNTELEKQLAEQGELLRKLLEGQTQTGADSGKAEKSEPDPGTSETPATPSADESKDSTDNPADGVKLGKVGLKIG